MIEFAKAHACGNDFLIVDQSQLAECDWRRAAIQLCARNTGVGADGVEYFRWLSDADGAIRLYNADGSIAEISGNGTRCVAAWMATQRGLRAGARVRIETDAGWRQCHIVSNTGAAFEIASSMGIPRIEDGSVRLRDGSLLSGAIVNTGNPHFVIRVENADFTVAGRTWQSVGEEICFHPDFPKQTNVEFLHVKNREAIKIRIFERGVGPTQSSGTGTCATGSAAIALHGCSSPLRVVAPGGAQQVDWDGSQSEILLTGPAVIIATGQAFPGVQN